VDETPEQAVPRVRVDHAPPITPRDRMLVEWVAQAKVGDPLPAPDVDGAAVARDASAAAPVWLEQHPADAGAAPG